MIKSITFVIISIFLAVGCSQDTEMLSRFGEPGNTLLMTDQFNNMYSVTWGGANIRTVIKPIFLSKEKIEENEFLLFLKLKKKYGCE